MTWDLQAKFSIPFMSVKARRPLCNCIEKRGRRRIYIDDFEVMILTLSRLKGIYGIKLEGIQKPN